MNGFEPLRRRIIDYTAAGQWSVVYDGPIEGCETEQLKTENAKLRELVRHMYECIERLDRTDEDGGCILCPYQEVEYECEFKQRMNELGV